MLLSAPVVWWGGSIFYIRAYESVRNRSLNMFTLIALGTATAWSYSAVAVLFPNIFPENLSMHMGVIPVYFEAAAVITALVLLG
jgi:Cu+-exporting ATPase